MTQAEIAAALRRHGWKDVGGVTPIGVTGNNHVLRMEVDGRAALVKEYFQHPADPRDRFSTERAFYTFLWESGIRSVPEPIAWYPDDRLGLFGFVPGQKPQTATAELVWEAIAFFVQLNRERSGARARALPDASEACFTIADHLACVDRRVARLTNIAEDSDFHASAAAFVQERLEPAWRQVRANIHDASGASNAALPEELRCITPSDFGFHNAIMTADRTLRFLDFEYAGWDDPAKTVCDFFCQPAVPVPHEHIPTFLEAIRGSFGGEDLVKRTATLLPAYQTKWCCIMLNDFLPAGDRRRAFSNPAADDTERRKRQLDKAVAFHRAVFP